MRLSPASASRLRGIFVCISGILWYNIGREFPIGGVRMNTLSRTEIEQVIRELLHKYHAEYALLFGSYARGEATAASYQPVPEKLHNQLELAPLPLPRRD